MDNPVIGRHYLAAVSGKQVTVRLEAIRDFAPIRSDGEPMPPIVKYEVTNLTTGRRAVVNRLQDAPPADDRLAVHQHAREALAHAATLLAAIEKAGLHEDIRVLAAEAASNLQWIVENCLRK